MKNRMNEAKDASLRRMLVENNILAGHAKSEARVEGCRRSRSAAELRRDVFMDYSYTKNQQDSERKTRIMQFEENLADELARRKAETLRREMDKRRICDGSEELRALKERLHGAKVNKERAMQLLDLETRKATEHVHEHHIAEHMENERLEHLELEHKLGIEKLRQAERVKVINQQQIASKEAQRQEALQEYLKEREQVEELVNKIRDEDATEKAARDEKQEEAKAMLKKFMIDQKVKQEQMEKAERNENDMIEAYARGKREREEQLAREAEKKAAEKAAVLKKQLAVAERASKDKEELELLRNDLVYEEMEAQEKRREGTKMRKKMEDKEEMKNAYLHQMKCKEDKAANFIEEEAKIKENLLRKFAEDDRLEQMNEQKRRMKVEQHKREAERLVALRREMFDASRAQERAQENVLRQEEGGRQLIIEAERQRLLREHAPGLRDFLPKNTLETQEDHDFVFGDRRRTK